jgi:hypothetical protein
MIQSMEKININIITVIVVVLLLCSCKCKDRPRGKYYYADTDHCYSIFFDSNNTFHFKRIRNNLSLSIAPDTFSGRWTEDMGILTLNGYRQPNNGNYFKVEEKYVDSLNNGTKIIQVKTGPFFWQSSLNDSVMPFFSNKIIVNDNEFKIPYSGIIQLKIEKIKSISYNWYLTDYPTYYPHNDSANWINIELLLPDNPSDYYPVFSYFYNAKFHKCKLGYEYSGMIFNKSKRRSYTH